MRIYYRGYVINEEIRKEVCAVQGLRPQRTTLAKVADPRAAMLWIDRDVIRRRVQEAGWISPPALSA